MKPIDRLLGNEVEKSFKLSPEVKQIEEIKFKIKGKKDRCGFQEDVQLRL